jgi:uncharacterized membrane protein
LLFLSSYFPLFLIFFVLFVGERPVLASGILTAGILGLLGMFVYLAMVNRLEPALVEVAEVRRRGTEVAGYILGYLMPFLQVPFEGFKQAIALTIFFLALCVVYVSSNMVYLNPMLNLVGFRLYEVTLKDGGEHALLTRRRVVRGDTVSAVKVGEDILMEKRK